VKVLKRLWQVHRGEFLVAMTALAGVLWAGLLKGVLVGAVISMVLLIRRASSPHVRLPRPHSRRAPLLGSRTPSD
jgi:MFS superfamily sulfate permease-like transporter